MYFTVGILYNDTNTKSELTEIKNGEIKDLNTKTPNLIDRDYKSTKPNHKWYVDISYIQLKNQWVYCSAIIDD